ncbi:MAG TPA: hypothetical protein VFV52_00800 [Bacilli bacterium]|nr:hypothetical protein [Bacilli bacterium]
MLYTLLIEYPLRKFITTKVLANNEYEEDQLAKGEGYLHKLMQVVPEFVATGRVTDSFFNEDGTQIITRGEFEVEAESEALARDFLDRYRTEIPDYATLRVLKIKTPR